MHYFSFMHQFNTLIVNLKWSFLLLDKTAASVPAACSKLHHFYSAEANLPPFAIRNDI